MRYDPARQAKFAVCAALVLAISLLSASALADSNVARDSVADSRRGAAGNPALAKAQKLIDDHKTAIARFMHPTSSLDKIDCTTTKTCDTGEFQVVYTFWFDSEKYHSSLRFKFFEDGSLDTIELAGTTTWIKPFQAADLLLKALFHLMPAPYASHLAGFRPQGTTKTALELWLRGRQLP